MMLPGVYMQPEILHWRRRSHAVTPTCPEPLHGAPVSGIERNALQIVENVIQAHRPQAVQKHTGVIEHHGGMLAFMNELRNKVAHAFVTPMEHGRVVIVADALVVHHVFEVADERRRAHVAASCWYQRLMHMKGHRKSAPNPREIDRTIRKTIGTRASHCFGYPILRSTDVGQSIDILRHG